MRKIAFQYGLMMFGGFVIFFLLMHFLGFSTNFNFRIFNGFIHLGVIYLAIKQYVNQKESDQFNYLPEVAVGMYTSFLGVTAFTIFMILFLSFSPEFMAEIHVANPTISNFLTPFTTSLYIFVEGIAISLIGSYTIARLIELGMAKN